MELLHYYANDPNTNKTQDYYTSQLRHPAFRTNDQSLWWERFLRDTETTLDFPDWIAATITATNKTQPNINSWDDVDMWYKKYELSESLDSYIDWIQNPTLR